MLARHFPPENNIASDRPFRFYKYLPRFGFDVHVVTASAQDAKQCRQNVVRAWDAPSDGNERIATTAIHHLLRPLVNEDSLHWALAAYREANRIIQKYRPDLIFSTSPPVISNVVAGLLQRRYGIPWVADFRDPIVGNADRKGSSLARLRDWALERWTFRRADALIANTDAALKMWQDRYPHYSEKMTVIWNGYDEDDVVVPMQLPRRDYRLLVHVGGMHRARHSEILLCAIHRLSQQGRIDPNQVRFRLIGPINADWTSVPTVVEDLRRVGLLEYDGNLVPRDQARVAMAKADSLVLMDWLSPHKTVQVPAKIFDYVRIGRPVLATTTRDSPVEQLLLGSGIRFVSIYPEDPTYEVDEKILKFLGLPVEPISMSSWFRNQFDALQHARKLESVLRSASRKSTVESRAIPDCNS